MSSKVLKNIPHIAVGMALTGLFAACSSVKEMAANTSHIVYAKAKPPAPVLSNA